MATSCYSAAVPARTRITIVGAGRLGRALALQVVEADYSIVEIVHRSLTTSKRKATALARMTGARATTAPEAVLDADLIWFCVPDREIAVWARRLAPRTQWKGKVAFHSSGALASDELDNLRILGASVAAVHPFMTFVKDSEPSLKDVAFAIEGDPAALRLAGKIVHDLGAEPFRIRKDRKATYHAFGGFTSPLLIALLITGEQVARAAGMSSVLARKRMLPIVRQTLENYERLGPAAAFTGPIVRGDSDVIRKHLQSLKGIPDVKKVYVALARAALRYLPSQQGLELKRVLKR